MNHITMKELPETMRPYEKCTRLGAQALSDAELLSVILRSGTKEMNSVRLSEEILRLSGGTPAGLYDLSYGDFLKLPGIGQVKACQLECVKALSKRIAGAFRQTRTVFSDPSAVAAAYMEEMRSEKKEKLLLLLLDTRCRLLSEEVLTVGSVNTTLFPVRDILSRALKGGAVQFILLHNHPTGDPAPSQDDIEATKRIRDASRVVDLCLLDHIVIGDRRYVSMSERGII